MIRTYGKPPMLSFGELAPLRRQRAQRIHRPVVATLS
jgi:hypothetical protein